MSLMICVVQKCAAMKHGAIYMLNLCPYIEKIFRKTPFTIQRRKIEMQRNLWLASAQLSFLLLVGNNEVGDSICEIFGGITHLVWTFFWVWTGIQILQMRPLHKHNFYRIGRLLSLFFCDTCI